ncbi:MAG: hypothetical protein HWN69_00640 [Desulfobacterales bacterium]|nr:hypothetical protein [Desulfobacterales bacterium]
MNDEINLPQGRQVAMAGIIGAFFGIAPASLLLLCTKPLLPKAASIILFTGYAVLIGWPFTYWWSKSIHDRINELHSQLEKRNELDPIERDYLPRRVPWMPAWLGIFERLFYCLLVGFDIASGATFIGVWIGIKVAGGWQLMSKGTTLGRAVLFSGLLGNAMSVLFGVACGLVLKQFL